MNAPLLTNLVPDRPDDPAAMSAHPVIEPEAARLDPYQLGALLRRNLLLIVAAIGGAVAAGLVVSMLTVPRYIAIARIQIEQQVDRVLPAEGVGQPAVGQDTERFLQTQLDVLKAARSRSASRSR